MSGLQLGDLILDPRRVLYIPSLKAVACVGLQEALGVSIAHGLRATMERFDSVLKDYKPEALLVLGPLHSQTALTGIARRWGKKTKIHFISAKADPDACLLAEGLGCEVHKDLVWDKYRFIEEEEPSALDLQLFTVIGGGSSYSIRIGANPFAGMKLAVFLKGIGRLTLPSLDFNSASNTVFQSGLERYDVFAVGHSRVLPLGKVEDLKKQLSLGGLPKATLGATGARKSWQGRKNGKHLA